jgi:hypothetical protein
MRQDRQEYWAKVVAEQEAAGQPVKAFCAERSLSLYNFYFWRRRLRQPIGEQAPRFALVKTKAPRETGAVAPELEVVFATGERLRIGRGVDAATLRVTLDALRA